MALAKWENGLLNTLKILNMNRFLTLSLFFLLGLPAMAQHTPQEWRDSLAVLNNAIRQSPSSTDLRLKKAAVNIELGQWDYAVEEYGRVLELDPKNLAARYFRAYSNVNRRHYSQACTDYEAFLAESPLHMEARLGLATVLEKLGRETDARDELNRLVEMFPDSAVCHVARASFESVRGFVDLALYDWDEAIRINPTNTDYWVSKAELLIRERRFSDARSVLEKAVRQGIPRGQLKPWFDRCKP